MLTWRHPWETEQLEAVPLTCRLPHVRQGMWGQACGARQPLLSQRQAKDADSMTLQAC